jgi:hypothetical protein
MLISSSPESVASAAVAESAAAAAAAAAVASAAVAVWSAPFAAVAAAVASGLAPSPDSVPLVFSAHLSASLQVVALRPFRAHFSSLRKQKLERVFTIEIML